MLIHGFLWACLFLTESFSETTLAQPYQQNHYGKDYGKTWVLFPDEDGFSHFVDLNETDGPLTRQLFEPEVSVQFRLYTRSNVDNYILFNESANPVNATAVNFVYGAPVKMVTHGWMSSGDKSAVINIKNAYLKEKNYNVIGVDWSAVADNYIYPAVAVQTKAVGDVIGKFIDALAARYNVTGDQLHLIGHSLGAHVMGNAASATHLNIGRVTGLDAARPLFEIPPMPDNLKLDRSDAIFVDVIHTCAKVLGVEGAIGHIDFYPNSGLPPQPGCFGPQEVTEACSHSRAHFLFADSINNPKAFPSSLCRSWFEYEYSRSSCNLNTVYMGENVSLLDRGTYYLATDSSKSYRFN